MSLQHFQSFNPNESGEDPKQQVLGTNVFRGKFASGNFCLEAFVLGTADLGTLALGTFALAILSYSMPTRGARQRE